MMLNGYISAGDLERLEFYTVVYLIQGFFLGTTLVFNNSMTYFNHCQKVVFNFMLIMMRVFHQDKDARKIEDIPG